MPVALYFFEWAPIAGGLIVLFLALCGLVILFNHLAKIKCDACGKRGSYWEKARKDGGPDLRYKENHLICPHCGYASRLAK